MKNINKEHPIHKLMAEGEEWIRREKNSKAKETFQKALELDPEFEPALLRLAALALREEQPSVSAGYFAKVGKLAYQRYLFAKALASYRRALAYDPLNQEYRKMVKHLHERLGQTHEASLLDIENKPQPQPQIVEPPLIQEPIPSVPRTFEPETSHVQTQEIHLTQTQREPELENEPLKVETPVTPADNSVEEQEDSASEDNDEWKMGPLESLPEEELVPGTRGLQTLADMTEEAIDRLAEIEVLIAE
ncbi:MAG TPA: hypothetical protein VJL87_00080, partial [Bdellovibrionota bacterium]|nr:hypothetical protein [Bdellovibrionota bacterium]